MPKFNVFTSNLDYTKTTEESDYVNVTGDTMTGDLEFGTSLDGIILRSSTSSIAPGQSLGLLLSLTYSETLEGGVKRWRLSVDDNGSLVTTQL